MRAAAFVILNILVFSSWYLFLYSRREGMIYVDRLIGTMFLGLTQIIATEMILGVVFSSLFALPLFLLNAGISLVLLMVLVIRKAHQGAAAELFGRGAAILKILGADSILSIITALFMLSLLWMVFIAYLFPSYSWDALYYHLPMVGQILQSGSIQEHVTPSFIQQYMNIFSKNVNLFFLWHVIFLESDVIVDLGQLFFTLAGVLSVYGIVVKLGVERKYGMYAALLFFFTPVLMLQSTINYVDGAVSMIFIVVVNFLLYLVPREADHERSPVDVKMALVLAGIAAGILLGSKATAPVFIAVTCAVVLMQQVLVRLVSAEHILSSSGKICFKDLVVFFAVPIAALGSYWYIRNWFLHGNPFYFMDVSLFGLTLFQGLESDWVEPAPAVIEGLNYMTRLVHVWMERVAYYIYDSRESGFGPVWFILFLPSIPFAFYHAHVKKEYGFLFAALLLGITFLVHPRNWFTRYVMFIVSFGAVSFALTLSCFRKRDLAVRFAALLLAVYTFITVQSPCIMPSQVRAFLDLSPEERTLTRMKPFNIDIKVRDEYGFWIWIENNIRKGDVLAHTFVDRDLDPEEPFFHGPLWNRGFTNSVVYIGRDNYKEWLQQIRDRKVNYVLYRVDSDEDQWIEKERKLFYSLRWMGNMQEKFRIVYSDKKYKIAEVRKS